jgi:hypothetical protein
MALLVTVLVGALVAPAAWAESEPQAGTVSGVTTYTYYPATALTGSGTAYSSAPRNVSGQDISKAVKYYNSMDVAVTVDLITSTGTITVTPQFSADQSNWYDATYTYVANTLVSTTAIVTSTGGTTATTTITSSSTPTEATYQVVLSADGTDNLKIPVSNEYFRVKIEYAGTTLTPTVKATLRNN